MKSLPEHDEEFVRQGRSLDVRVKLSFLGERRQPVAGRADLDWSVP